MKNALILAIAILFISCNKNNISPVAKATQNNVYEPHWIPNWHGGDTLIGEIVDTMSHFAGYDTMYTATIGDTSCVIYNGVKLYLWTSIYYNVIRNVVDPFRPNYNQYGNSYIGTKPFDTTYGLRTHGMFTIAIPSKYLKEDGVTWQHQLQMVMLSECSNFKTVSLNGYTSHTTY